MLIMLPPEAPPEPREEHEMLGASDDPRRVELHHREIVYRLGDRVGAGSGEALAHDAQPPGRSPVDLELCVRVGGSSRVLLLALLVSV